MKTNHIVTTILASFLIISKCPALITDGISGYWTFDETSGAVAHEASGQGLNGALMNYAGGQGNWTSGRIGGALQFGGPATQQYVVVPDFTKPTTSLTLSAWVWADSLTLWGTIAANWDGGYGTLNYSLFVSDPYFSLYFAEPSPWGINVASGIETNGVPPVSVGEWHHVAVVADSSTYQVQFWRDGQLSGEFFYGGNFYPAPVPQLDIGGTSSYGDPAVGYWEGKIDDLALWTRALSNEEIASIYNAGLNGQSMISLVPEPGTLAITTVGCLVFVVSRFRRRSTR